MKFYQNTEIERIAEEKLVELSQILGKTLEPPIPIDLMAEKILGLNFLWEPIDENPGEFIFGGLVAQEKLIILNEKHRDIFEQKPGLERSTKGHEMGHWELFIDKKALDHPHIPGITTVNSFVQRNSNRGPVEVISALIKSQKGLDIVREIDSRSDHPDEARAVNRFAAAISMPRELIKSEAAKIDRTHWPNLYRLAEKFEVTITALSVRLNQLGMLHVSDDGKLHESIDKAYGQTTLDLA